MGGCDSEGNPITVSFGWVLGLNNPICLTSAVLLKRIFSMSIFQKIVTILYKIDYDSSFKVFPTKLKKI